MPSIHSGGGASKAEGACYCWRRWWLDVEAEVGYLHPDHNLQRSLCNLTFINSVNSHMPLHVKLISTRKVHNFHIDRRTDPG